VPTGSALQWIYKASSLCQTVQTTPVLEHPRKTHGNRRNLAAKLRQSDLAIVLPEALGTELIDPSIAKADTVFVGRSPAQMRLGW
jgi:hypothetical protein